VVQKCQVEWPASILWRAAVQYGQHGVDKVIVCQNSWLWQQGQHRSRMIKAVYAHRDHAVFDQKRLLFRPHEAIEFVESARAIFEIVECRHGGNSDNR
jgi:hypothetical protein